ncbi:MAG: hypothetical protein MUF62_00800, partial [Chitinophagaceae bacterium]|nr:hypothetical protein [Chitinophagaceae bacterium]
YQNDLGNSGLFHYSGTTFGWLPVSELQRLGSGWRLAGRNPANYGPVGSDAVDFSYSITAGTANGALGRSSAAFGFATTASGTHSLALGSLTQARGTSSFAAGTAVIAKARSAVSIGENNDDTDNPDPNTSQASDRLFQIGNGSYSTDLRQNALTVLRNGQVGFGTVAPHASALLQLTSNDKGFLPPQLTLAQRTAIAGPAPGLLLFQTDGSKGLYIFDGA